MKKYSWIALAVFLADRGTKYLWDRIPKEGMPLIPGILGLFPARNTGMAFSLFSGRPWLLGILSLVLMIGAFLYFRGKRLTALTGIGLMLMLGGAAGNMTDRFLTGYVPDLIELLFVRFAIFNVADVSLVAGCAIVVTDLFRGERNGRNNHSSDW